MKNALITGITGQDGYYLAELLLEKGYDVIGMHRRVSSSIPKRLSNLLNDYPDSLILRYGDLTDSASISKIILDTLPDEVYNLGAQSHVKVSFENPVYTADVDGLGTLRVLEAIRQFSSKSKFYQASTSELFGEVYESPQNEKTPFNPQSPYAVSKLFAYWCVRNYRKAYGLYACNGILFNHECVSADTPILYRKNGCIDIKPICELVPHRTNPRSSKVYQTSPSGLEVWDGVGWTNVTLATATWRDKTQSGIVEVNCRGAYYKATEEHISFLDGDIGTQTKNIVSGDKLTLKELPQFTNDVSVSIKEAELLGMLVADGSITDGRATFTKNDESIRNRAGALWHSVSGEWSQKDESGRSGFDPNVRVGRIRFNGNHDLLALWEKEIYTKQRMKRIPKRILNATENARKAFIKGYQACDGLKGGHKLKQELKSFTTNSTVLAQGLFFLLYQTGYRVTLHPETRGNSTYYHLNINVKGSTTGQHLIKPLNEVKSVECKPIEGWVFDLATESGTFSAGIGLGWIHNSPVRGEDFVTRKITKAVAGIAKGTQEILYLGNLDAKRDWGYAKDYVEAMWLILQQENPDDYVIASGESHSVREFVELAFSEVGMKIKWDGSGVTEKGIDSHTGKIVVAVDPAFYRPAEVETLTGDCTKAENIMGWKRKTSFSDLVRMMVEADLRVR